MAAPTVRGRTAPAAGLSRSSPAGTQIGDMVICFTWERAGAGIPTHTLQSDFAEIFSHAHNDGSTDGRLSVAYKVATASGANSYQAYTSSVGTETWTGIVVVTAGTFAATAINIGPTVSISASSTNNAAPDPSSLNLGTSRDWLVFAIGAWHHGSSATITPTAPANYGNLIEVAGASTGELAIADRSLTAPASENPAAFGDNIAPNGTVAATVGIASPIVFTGAVGIDGAAGITSAGQFFSVLSASAVVGAAADISVSGSGFPAFSEIERAASVSAVAGVESSGIGFSTVEASTSFDSLVTIATGRQVDFSRSVSFAGAGSLATAAHRVLDRSFALNTGGVVTVASQSEYSRSALLSALASISASGNAVTPASERSATLDSVGSITVSGLRIVERGVGISALGAINSIAYSGHERSVLLNAGIVVSVSGEVFAGGGGGGGEGLAMEFERAASMGAAAAITVTGMTFKPHFTQNIPAESRTLTVTAVDRVLEIEAE